MRHRNGQKALGRPTDQRLAILKSLVAGVLEHGAVTTTETRAKQVRPILEKVITMAREDTLVNRRRVRQWIPIGPQITTRTKFINVTGSEPAYSQAPRKPGQRPLGLKAPDRVPSGERLIHKLFTEIGQTFKDQPGGYTRITRLGGEPHINAKGVQTIRPARRGDGASMVRIELVK